MTRTRVVFTFVTMMLLLTTNTALGASFIVPTDEELLAKSDAIVTGTVEGSYARETETTIETVYEIRIDRAFKGPIVTNELLRVVSPGGVIGDRGVLVPGAARFRQGDRVLVFLTRERGWWTPTDLTLGRFHFRTSTTGERLLVRDMEDVVGWDHAGRVHREKVRKEEGFLRFIEERSKGRDARQDYEVNASDVTLVPEQDRFGVAASAGSFPAATYTDFVNDQPIRWPNMGPGVNFYKRSDQNISGASDGGVSVIQDGLNAWNAECGSVINLIYAGAIAKASANHDATNVVEFNDPQGRISGSWTGSGTIGICFISFAGTHSFSGQAWLNITDADVVFQDGYPATTSSFRTAMTHELGHGIGWRHSNQNHQTGGACNPSVEECTSAAIMNSSITTFYNHTLQPWDVNAAQSVYPGGSCEPTCTAVTITAQPTSRTITGGSTTLSVSVAGTAPFTYQWYVGSSGNTASPITGATSSSVTVSPPTTTSYWVRVSNACGTVNSVMATVTVTIPPRKGLRTDFDRNGRSEMFWRNASTGANMLWFVNGSTVTSTADVPATATQWSPVTMGDFNGDGRSDILWRSGASNYMWLMNGSSAAGQAVVSQATNWNFVSSGDFDGDGRFDLFWRDPATGANMIWFMSGATVRATGVLPATATQWSVKAIGDFNGDGRWDIFWRNTSGANYLWLMNGATASGQPVMSNPASWDVVGTGDFNGDGRHDIFWRDSANGSNKLWLLNGSTPTERALPATSPSFAVGLVGDFNGDRTDDVAWRRSDGVNAMWLMVNGNPSSAALPSLATAWQMFGKK